MKLIPILALLLLSACGQTTMTKPNLTSAEFNKDLAQCEYEAAAAAAAYTGMKFLKERELTIACLRAKGYTEQ